MSRTGHGLGFYFYKLTSYPVIVSWVLVRDMRRATAPCLCCIPRPRGPRRAPAHTLGCAAGEGARPPLWQGKQAHSVPGAGLGGGQGEVTSSLKFVY